MSAYAWDKHTHTHENVHMGPKAEDLPESGTWCSCGRKGPSDTGHHLV